MKTKLFLLFHLLSAKLGTYLLLKGQLLPLEVCEEVLPLEVSGTP